MSEISLSEEDETIQLVEKVLNLKKSVEMLAKHKNLQIRGLEHELELTIKAHNKNIETFYSKEKQSANSFHILHQKYIDSQHKIQTQEKEIQVLREQLKIQAPEVLEKQIITDQRNEIERMKTEMAENKKFVAQKEEALKLAMTKLELSEKHINRLKKEYFFSLTIGIKFNLMVNGYECPVPTSTLWDHCQKEKIDYSGWRTWIEKKMVSLAVPKKEHLSKSREDLSKKQEAAPSGQKKQSPQPEEKKV